MNRRKHRLPLAAGQESWVDRSVDYGEERWITLGMGEVGILFVVTVEYAEDHIHIISVRRAERHEQQW